MVQATARGRGTHTGLNSPTGQKSQRSDRHGYREWLENAGQGAKEERSCERVKRGLINSILESTGEIRGAEDTSTDITPPLDQERKKIKKNKASVTCETISNDLMFVTGVLEREKTIT